MNKKIDYDTLWIIECVWFSYGLRCKKKRKNVFEVMRYRLGWLSPGHPFGL